MTARLFLIGGSSHAGKSTLGEASPTISVVVAFRPTVWRSILDGPGAIRLSNRHRMSLNTIAIWRWIR